MFQCPREKKQKTEQNNTQINLIFGLIPANLSKVHVPSPDSRFDNNEEIVVFNS